MSRGSKSRRDARKKKQAKREGRDQPRQGSHEWSGGDPFGFAQPGMTSQLDRMSELYRYVDIAIDAAFGPHRGAQLFDEAVAGIHDVVDLIDWAMVESALTQHLDRALDRVFEGGWQPAEIVHLATRDLGKPENRLLVIQIGSYAVTRKAFDRAPEQWVEQLSALSLGSRALRGTAAFRHWQRTEGSSRHDLWAPVLRLLSRITMVGPLPELLPLPSSWGTRPATDRARDAGGRPGRGPDPRILNRVRGLLAKAESSEYPDEAEALSAKAQDLMTRYAVESAMLDAEADTDLRRQVKTIRLLVDNPYPEAKVALLGAVAGSNGVRSLWHKLYGLVSLVGMPVDLELCELLYTSLLVQASHAMREAGTGRSTRSPSFRRSFLIAYANRIGERLAEARERATAAAVSEDLYGKELVPVLAARTEAIDDTFDEQFPDVVQIPQTVTNTQGWAAGRHAAENADLTGGRDSLPG